MNFIYVDLEIFNSDLSGFSNTNLYSNIIFKNQSLLERLKDSLDSRFKFKLQNLADIETQEEFIVWTSNIVSINTLKQSLFLEKLYYSQGSFKWSQGRGFIFKGTKKDFDDSKHNNLALEDFFIEINDFQSFQALLETSLDTRHFNEIEKFADTYVKKSKDINKLEMEFKFLAELPPSLNSFFIKPHSFKKTKDQAQYSMPRINYLDISRRHINGDLLKEDIDILFEQLNIYFERVFEISFKKTGREYDFISYKTKKRIDDFRNLELFNPANDLIKFSSKFESLDHAFEQLNFFLEKNRNKINKKGSVISHGDLCFSNILASKDFRNLIFIDPMGGSIEESMKSVYYDFAKLSHSILGQYDMIIHGLGELEFNKDMEIFISFKKEKNLYLEENFLQLLDKFNLNLGTTRLIEASLFLSMLPLHSENQKRTIMLALRGCEILREITENRLI